MYKFLICGRATCLWKACDQMQACCRSLNELQACFRSLNGLQTCCSRKCFSPGYIPLLTITLKKILHWETWLRIDLYYTLSCHHFKKTFHCGIGLNTPSSHRVTKKPSTAGQGYIPVLSNVYKKIFHSGTGLPYPFLPSCLEKSSTAGHDYVLIYTIPLLPTVF